MAGLQSNSKGAAGIYRALVINATDTDVKIYIPALHRDQMPFKLDGNGKISGLLDSEQGNVFTTAFGTTLNMKFQDYPNAQICCWIGRSELKVGDSVWVVFENGDIEYPIVIGMLGSTMPYGTLAALVGGSNAGSMGGAGAAGTFNGSYYEGLPTYNLTEDQITYVATWVTGECGGEDSVACQRIASQMANLSEYQHNDVASYANLRSTLESGWYDDSSFTRGVTESAKSAVRTCLVEGRRALPRYVVEFCTFGPKWVGTYKPADQWQQGDEVLQSFTNPPSSFYFFCFDKQDTSSPYLNIMGYTKDSYNRYKEDDNKVKQSTSVVIQGDLTLYNGMIRCINGTDQGYDSDEGLDIGAPIGTPVYSPCNGTFRYSEYGHTPWDGPNDTAYSIGIWLDSPISFAGEQIEYVFLTHMSSLIYNIAPDTSNQRVQMGELIGYSGTANGSPHLHIGLSHRQLEPWAPLRNNQVRAFFNSTYGETWEVGK